MDDWKKYTALMSYWLGEDILNQLVNSALIAGRLVNSSDGSRCIWVARFNDIKCYQ